MKSYNHQGFTLVELIVVLGIIAVILVISVPVLANLVNQDTERQEKSRTFYYSVQAVMTDIRATNLLPKNENNVVIVENAQDGANWCYYIIADVHDNKITALDFILTNHSDDLENALRDNEINSVLKSKLEHSIIDEKNDFRYIVKADSEYRVEGVIRIENGKSYPFPEGFIM